MIDTLRAAYECAVTHADRCWCGEALTEADLDAMYEDLPPCGGEGFVTCECGGDFCACHNHGEVECPGCPDCTDNDEERDDV